jgi:hypothetical protein
VRRPSQSNGAAFHEFRQFHTIDPFEIFRSFFGGADPFQVSIFCPDVIFLPGCHFFAQVSNFLPRSQSYGRELQRQRCKNLLRHE